MGYIRTKEREKKVFDMYISHSACKYIIEEEDDDEVWDNKYLIEF